jgi:proteic killer suppression protein
VLDISYKNNKIKKVCTDAKVAEKNYGKEMAEKIQMRIDQITAADSVEMMVQLHIGRCHQLVNNRKGQYAVDLVQPYRLVFEKHGDEIQVAHIMEIVDYH